MNAAHGTVAVWADRAGLRWRWSSTSCLLMMPLAILLVASAAPDTSLYADEPPAAAATPIATSSPEAPPATPPTPVTPQPAPQPATPPTLAEQIDQLLPPDYQQLAAPETEPGLALRRLSLDLRGVVPTREELDAFVADPSPDRWNQWTQKFLADPLCDEHLVQFLDRTLMLRRPFAQVDRMAWINFLREQVAADTPIDALVKQLLHAPWWNKDQRAVQRFYLDRGGDPHLITRDLGRVFLGRDMQCAQCHDHPIVEDFRQIDYHGLLAYVSTSGLAEVGFKDAENKDQKIQLYVERAAGDAPFESVFDKGVPFRSGPRLSYQTEQFEEYLSPESRYQAALPADALAAAPMPPKVSRRQLLSEQLTARTNRAFVTNMANRFWALAFGRGLVQPLDMHHPENPPSHPQLLDAITDGLVACDMRPRKFLEQLVTSKAYRRGAFASLQIASGAAGIANATPEALAELRQRATEQLTQATQNKTNATATESTLRKAYEAARDAWRKTQGERAAVRTELDTAEAAMLAAHKKSTDAANVFAAAQKKHADNATRVALLDESAAKLQQSIDLSGADDAELKQAIAVAKQRAEAARGQIPATEKAVADTKAALDAIAPELAAASAKVQEVVAKLQPIHQALTAADTQMLAARAQWAAARRAEVAADRATEQHQEIVAWLDELDSDKRLVGEVAGLQQVVAAIQTELPPVMTQLADLQQQLAASQAAEQVAASEKAKAVEAMARHNSEIEQLQASLEALKSSVKLVSTTEPLTAAQTALQNEIEARRTQAGALLTAVDAATQAVVAANAVVVSKTEAVNAQVNAKQAIEQRLVSAKTAVDSKQAELDAVRSAAQQKWQSIQEVASNRFALASLQPLTPEQLCWSTLRVTGVLDAYIRIEAAELEKKSALPPDADAATRASRHRQAVRGAYDKLRGNADVFVSLYASGPDKTEDDFFASADQALYTANAGAVYAWAGPGNDNVTQKAIAMTDNAQIAQSIYWTLLCRQPTAEESALVNEQLVAAGEARNQVLQEMVWGILAGAEFRFVY